MLPPNIDLTEHRDFGESDFSLGIIDFDIPIDDDVPVTSDQYERMLEYEKIFGRKYHHNQVRDVLGYIYDIPKKDYIDWKSHCARCGKTLVPWDNLGGICRECDSQCNQSYGYGQIPWQEYKSSRIQDRIMDIFSMR